MGDIPADLFQRISERANDPMRRTFTSGAQATAQPLDLEAMLGDLAAQQHPAAEQLQGMFGNLAKMMGGMGALQQGLGGMLMAGPEGTYRLGGAESPAEPATLAGPPGDAALADAEKHIGRTLPTELRQLYAIGDGGFGPGEGLFPLAELVERYTECVREPIGPGGQLWPANLIPLFDQSPQLLCLDADTGQVICWDPEMIEDVEEGEDWDQSFVPEADSLTALMEAWLASPTMTEQMEEARQQPFTVPQATIDFYAAMSPEERAEYGFEGEDWVEQLKRSFSRPY
jgi:hypothetical protein